LENKNFRLIGQQTVAARNGVNAKKLLAVCFKTFSRQPKIGLLAARAISTLDVAATLRLAANQMRLHYRKKSARTETKVAVNRRAPSKSRRRIRRRGAKASP